MTTTPPTFPVSSTALDSVNNAINTDSIQVTRNNKEHAVINSSSILSQVQKHLTIANSMVISASSIHLITQTPKQHEIN